MTTSNRSVRSVFLRCLLVLAAALSLAWTPPRRATAPPVFTVNSVADGVCETAPGNGICTLRAAVIKANHYPGGGVTIHLPASAIPYAIQIPQVVGTYGEADGDFNLNASMVIAGAGASSTIVEGNNIDRLFNITASVTVTLSGLTLRTGYDDLNAQGGGAILNRGRLTLANSVLTADRAQNKGGAVRNSGVMTITNTLIDGGSPLGAAAAFTPPAPSPCNPAPSRTTAPWVGRAVAFTTAGRST
jgi:hypothetical protein